MDTHTATINSTAYIERLLAHFFSDHRLHFNEDDCQCFLMFANKSDGGSGMERFHTKVSDNVLKFYLSKTLGTGRDESLGMFLPKVSLCTSTIHLQSINVI